MKNPDYQLDVYSDDNQLLFQVPINKIENFERPAWEDRTEYAKTFAVSDLHGRFDLFAAILKTGEVINDKYEWIYGSNHLVIDGDIFEQTYFLFYGSYTNWNLRRKLLVAE